MQQNCENEAPNYSTTHVIFDFFGTIIDIYSGLQIWIEFIRRIDSKKNMSSSI